MVSSLAIDVSVDVEISEVPLFLGDGRWTSKSLGLFDRLQSVIGIKLVVASSLGRFEDGGRANGLKKSVILLFFDKGALSPRSFTIVVSSVDWITKSKSVRCHVVMM